MLSTGNSCWHSNLREQQTGREARKDGEFKVLHLERTSGMNWRREVREDLVRNTETTMKELTCQGVCPFNCS